MTRGYQGLLGHPAMLAVAADTKFCWALACFIDFFSSAHYTNSVMDHFRGLKPAPGDLVTNFLHRFYRSWLETRFNEPTDQLIVEFFIPAFRSALPPSDRDALTAYLPPDAWHSWEKLRYHLGQRAFTIQAAPMLVMAVKHDRSGQAKLRYLFPGQR